MAERGADVAGRSETRVWVADGGNSGSSWRRAVWLAGIVWYLRPTAPRASTVSEEPPFSFITFEGTRPHGRLTSPLAGDLDNDGRIDLVLGSPAAREVYILLGRAAATGGALPAAARHIGFNSAGDASVCRAGGDDDVASSNMRAWLSVNGGMRGIEFGSNATGTRGGGTPLAFRC